MIALYDACVLYPASLRDLLLRIAVEGLCQARFSHEILDEVFDNLRLDRPDLDPAKLARTRAKMCEAIPECLITGHLDLLEDLSLPDPADRHVLAAAIRAEADLLVTDNLKDFPKVTLAPHGLEAVTADEFVTRLCIMNAEQVFKIVEQQAADLQNPPTSTEKLLEKLEANGLRNTVGRLRSWRGPGGSA